MGSPPVDQAAAEVREGDALAVLRSIETQTVDAMVTDPPYCSGGWQEAQRTQAVSMLRDSGRESWFRSDAMSTSGLCWLLREVAIEAHRILRPGGWMLVFCDWRMIASLAPALESSGLRMQSLLTWDKASPGQGAGFRTQAEHVIALCKPPATVFAHDVGNVIRAPRVPPASRRHPTEKPWELMRELVRVVAPQGGLVVDPFAGSGSTGVACRWLGIRWLGVEIDPAWAAVARERLESTWTTDGGLFAGAAAPRG